MKIEIKEGDYLVAVKNVGRDDLIFTIEKKYKVLEVYDSCVVIMCDHDVMVSVNEKSLRDMFDIEFEYKKEKS